MTPRILVGIDGSEPSMNALVYTLEAFPDANITALSVVSPSAAMAGSEYFDSSVFEQQRKQAEGYLEAASETASEYDQTLETDVRFGSPSRELIEYANETAVDHIVVGSHGRSGLSRILLGSVAESVVRRSPVPVTVVR